MRTEWNSPRTRPCNFQITFVSLSLVSSCQWLNKTFVYHNQTERAEALQIPQITSSHLAAPLSPLGMWKTAACRDQGSSRRRQWEMNRLFFWCIQREPEINLKALYRGERERSHKGNNLSIFLKPASLLIEFNSILFFLLILDMSLWNLMVKIINFLTEAAPSSISIF